MDRYSSLFDGRTASEWIAEAEQFERMSERFQTNPELSRRFRKLAHDARKKAMHHHG